MVVVVVSEEEVVDMGWPEAGFDELVGCCWSAVEHQKVAVDFEDGGGTEAERCRMRRACAEDVEGGWHLNYDGQNFE